MSRRRGDATSSFSLRTAFSASIAPAQKTQSHASALASVPHFPQNVGAAPAVPHKLTFTLNGLNMMAGESLSPSGISAGAGGGGAVKAQGGGLSPMPLPHLTNAFARPAMMNATPSADALRLNAVIEDLTQRLRKSTDKSMHLENSVARISQALAGSKSEADTRVGQLMAEVASLQKSEQKIRAEMKARPAVAETKIGTQFSASVRTALEVQELSEKATASEKRVASMEERHSTLLQQVKLLEQQRVDAFQGIKTDGVMTTEALETLVCKAAKASKKLSKSDVRRQALEDEVQRFTALAESRREDAAAALRESTLAQASLKDAVHDATVAKEQVAVHTKAAEDARASMPMLPNVITGVAPTRCLGDYEHTRMSEIAVASNGLEFGCPFHFDMDAPIALGAVASTAPEQDGMITAVVDDIKLFFQDRVDVHEALTRVGMGTAAAPATIAMAS